MVLNVNVQFLNMKISSEEHAYDLKTGIINQRYIDEDRYIKSIKMNG